METAAAAAPEAPAISTAFACLGSLGFEPLDGKQWRIAGTEPVPKGGRRWAPVPYAKAGKRFRESPRSGVLAQPKRGSSAICAAPGI
jgi:hypothetical protein